MTKSTQELLEILKQAPQIDDYIEKEEDNMVQMELYQYLQNLLEKKQLSPSQLITLSGLDRTYTYQILSGKKNPSRDKVLAISFAMGLSFEETQSLLKATGYPILYARLKRDSILIFALQHKVTLTDVNELLFDFKFDTLV